MPYLSDLRAGCSRQSSKVKPYEEIDVAPPLDAGDKAGGSAPVALSPTPSGSWRPTSDIGNGSSTESDVSTVKRACDFVVCRGLGEMMDSDSAALGESDDVEVALGVAMSKCSLVFEDERFETLYSMRIARQLRQTIVYSYLFIMLYSVYSLYGSLFSGDTMLVLRWNAAPNIAYNAYWIAALLAALALLLGACCSAGRCRRGGGGAGGRSVRELRTAVFLSLVLWLRCLLGNRYRVARLFGEDPGAAFGVSEGGDDELLLHTITLVVYLAMYTHMRFKLMLLPGLSAVFSYPVSTFLSESCAFGASRGEDAAAGGGHDAASQAINSLMLAAVVAFVFVGQRQIEVTRRRAFLQRIESETARHTMHLREEGMQRKKLLLHQQRQAQLSIFNEVDDRAANFSTMSLDLDVAMKEGPGSELLLAQALPAGATTDWHALEQAVTRIRDPDYSLREFHNHMVAAFPELTLYVFRPAKDEVADNSSGSLSRSDEVLSSGRSRSEELARTFGAFYALYWLIRCDIDGQQGFCFGYDEDWKLKQILDGPPPEELKRLPFSSMTETEKKLTFYHNFPWHECNKLLRNSGIIRYSSDAAGVVPGTASRSTFTNTNTSSSDSTTSSIPRIQVCNDRLRAMLVLTALHDVMKNEALCPTVQPGHGPFRDYAAGQVILDHDIALDYVLTYFGELLPSYHGLDEQSQRVVRFTQGKMGFNNGWLVQGESPPGALFHTFKGLIDSGGANQEDVAFYFAHWVTDLAGAEPQPLAGSLKFVQGFPDFVLASFFRSFAYVHHLSDRTETQVLQEYLTAQWLANSELGPLPAGDDAVALMRLALQAQGRSGLVRPAFEALDGRDRETLSDELARTGLAGQHYEGFTPRPGQPALLVYYAPAFLQKNGDQLRDALRILAEVYREGRMLYPLHDPRGDGDGGGGVHTVTLRIEQLKDLPASEITCMRVASSYADAEGFFLVRRSDLVAVVERHPLSAINRFIAEGVRCAFLDLSSPSGSHCSSPRRSPSPTRRSPLPTMTLPQITLPDSLHRAKSHSNTACSTFDAVAVTAPSPSESPPSRPTLSPLCRNARNEVHDSSKYSTC